MNNPQDEFAEFLPHFRNQVEMVAAHYGATHITPPRVLRAFLVKAHIACAAALVAEDEEEYMQLASELEDTLRQHVRSDAFWQAVSPGNN